MVMNFVWNNDSTLRATKLAALDAALVEGQLGRGRWMHIGHLIDGEALRYADSLIGIPVNYAFLSDGVFAELPADIGPVRGLQTIKAVQLKTDLSKVVPTVMVYLLESVRRLVDERSERDSASKDTGKQLQLLENAVEVIRSSFAGVLTGAEEDVRVIFAASGLDSVAYIAQNAVEAVLTRAVKEPKTMLDEDKKRVALEREGNEQAAGMAALAAVRAAAELFIADAKSVALASQANDVESVRLAEQNARSIFYIGVADSLAEAVRTAPVLTFGAAAASFLSGGIFGGGKRDASQPSAERGAVLSSSAPLAESEGDSDWQRFRHGK
jgi:hypothetical protein